MRKWSALTIHAVVFTVFCVGLAGSSAAAPQRVAIANPNADPSLYGTVVVPIPGVSEYIQVFLEYETGTSVYLHILPPQRFAFYDLKVGTYHIVIEVPGYQPVRERIDIIAGAPPMMKAIFLSPDSGSTGGVDLRKKYSKKAVEEFEKAEDLMARGDMEKAAERLNAAVKAAPDFFEAQNLLGTVYYKLRRLREAEAAFRRAMMIDAKAPLPRINLGMLLLEAADGTADIDKEAAAKVYSAAYDLLSEAVKLDSNSALAAFLFGFSCYRSGRYDEAEQFLKHAVEMDGRMGQARIMLANVHIRKENWTAALTQLDTYLKDHPNAPEASQVLDTRSRVADMVKANKR